MSAGSSTGQGSNAYGQRGWKRHPDGGSAGFGTSPGRLSGRTPRPSGRGTAPISASLYGCAGCVHSGSVWAVSTIRPRYITETSSATCLTIARSCEISSSPTPMSRARFVSRFANCACADASSDASGSSRTMTDGSAASARAMATRCRWPPENSCGYRTAAVAGSPTSSKSVRTRAARSRPATPSPTCDPTVRRGLSDEYGFWKTSWSRTSARGRARRDSGLTGLPSNETAPLVAGTSPTAARASVDLPQPDSPTSPTIRPASTEMLAPATARTRPPRPS